ncbi:MAG: DNA translocase FtsK 4TM domain-containing protein [Anaerolineae bacterium]|nr:DNA translocase FtsK 4TM domain-containing protein [Anaerolineae bacterium]
MSTRRKGTSGQKPAPRPPARPWWVWLTSPIAQQTLAVGLILLSILTFLTLLRITSGRWTDAWLHALQFVFGWGAVPVAFAIGWGGVLILQHHLDRPIVWRWRPVVGLELLFFGLLALTHLLLGHRDPWALLQSGWGGGVIGWALAHILSLYLGPLVAGVLLIIFTLLGLGLALDWTLADIRERLGRRRAIPTPARSRAARPAQPAARPAPRPAPSAPSAPTPSPAERPAPATAQPVPAPTAPTRAVPVPPSAPAHLAEPSLPPLDLLDEGEEVGLSDEEVRRKSRIIVETLAQFGLPVQVVEVRRGPAVTQFGIAPGFTERPGPDGQRRPHKVRVSQIAALADDLALALAAPSLRVEAPVPGRSVVGIEVPNDRVSRVSLRSVMESEAFAAMDSPLTVALGEDVAGTPVVADLSTMPHLLIAGTTGSGKSVCIKALATCLAMTNRPDQLRFVMIDPKMVELVHFNGLPHLLGHTEVELERIGRGQIDAAVWEKARGELGAELEEGPEFLFESERFQADRSLLDAITPEILLRLVYNAPSPGTTEVIIRPSNRQEMAFKLKSADQPFALVKIGDISGWLREELAGYEVVEGFEDESFFQRLNEDDSEMNILMGSRSFYEGWDSNRPNVIAYINIGMGTEARKFILQSVGRGVRIEPVPGQRKRLPHLHSAGIIDSGTFHRLSGYVFPLEALFIFGTNRVALNTVIQNLSQEQRRGAGHGIARPGPSPIPAQQQAERSGRPRELQRFEITEEELALLAEYVEYIGDDCLLMAYHGLGPQSIRILRACLREPERYFNTATGRRYGRVDLLLSRVLAHFHGVLLPG